MQLVQVQIGQTFPVILGCFPDATVALLRPNGVPFQLVIDRPADHIQYGVWGYFDSRDFTLNQGGDQITFQYNTTYRYKEIPLLLAWLQQQQLHSPL